MGAGKCRNGNARRSARAVVEEHNAFLTHISIERRASSLGRRGYFWGSASVLEHTGHLRLLYEGGWVRVGSTSMRNGAGGG